MKSSKLEELFLSVCHDWFESNRGYEVRGELGVFSSAMVVWLGIFQRISGGSLQAGVSELSSRLSAESFDRFISRSSRKLRQSDVSLNTGGLSRARERISVESMAELFSVSANQIFKNLELTGSRPVYVMDGQVLAIARTKGNLKEFGRTGNGEGELHFPRIRAVSVHELRSGIAKSVAIGNWLDHEVTLGREAVTALPKGSILIMDRGFDKPEFIRFVRQQGIDVVVRLQTKLGQRLTEKTELPVFEKQVTWKGSSKVGQIVQEGRVIKYTDTTSGFRSSEFYFFTSAEHLRLEEVVALYRQRVRVETFIRDLKQTLNLFFVRSKKPDNIKKEILIAYLTFNLLRAIMEKTAKELEIEPERMSFTATIRITGAYARSFAAARNEQERKQIEARFRKNMFQAKLPLRTKQRNYPRVIKYPKDRYETAGVVRKSLPADLVNTEKGK